MTRPFASLPSPLVAGSVALAAAGVASNIALTSPPLAVGGLVLIAVGVAGVTADARSAGVDRLGVSAARWWTLAFVAFVPYALAVAPTTDTAAAAGDAFAGPVVSLALQSVAGAVVCCAVAYTALYGFARYGIHPGRPSPEERVLADGGDE